MVAASGRIALVQGSEIRRRAIARMYSRAALARARRRL